MLDKPTRQGRPPTFSREERRQRILAAASQVFLGRGYTNASIDDVVKACGMSKKTVYQAFDSKEHLFRELVEAEIAKAPDLQNLGTAIRGAENHLRYAFQQIAEFIFSDHQVALARLVVTESPTSPELSAIFYEKAVLTGRAMLTDTLRALMVEGEISGPQQPEELADILMGGLLGRDFFAVLISRTTPPSKEAIAERVTRLLRFIQPALKGNVA
ncbi:TetR/AcrR family transcriptional regulator [Tianweitania sediminis]|uniref:TetR/AcrR family transcriptional regulator n=1 Tax=Tianweitania sediminis TaxID=1502156 RepID=A0A8J7RQU7_9HYPH|nr:TetR/AcrR family transcriptional regulator [Tianweitania sediminis]MBP0441471.1 TetR/AcrR family transcriptional regulator [Tianweitania sediminis]